MKLTVEQAQQVISHITVKAQGKAIVCPICGHNEWSVNNVVTEMREFQNGNLVVGGETAVMPFVSITCKKCAHTLFINAILAGIVSPQPQADKVDDSQQK